MATTAIATPSLTDRIWDAGVSLKRTKEKVVDPVIANAVALGKSATHFFNAYNVFHSGSNTASAHPVVTKAAASAGEVFLVGGFIATLFSVKNGVKRLYRAWQDGDTESAVYHGPVYLLGKIAGAAGLGGKVIEHGAPIFNASVPAYVPLISDVALIAQAGFSLVSGIYGEVKTRQFEGELTSRVTPLSSGKSPEELLYELVFGNAPQGETFEQQTERLKERKEIIDNLIGKSFYEAAAEYFGVTLDENGQPTQPVPPYNKDLPHGEEDTLNQLITHVGKADKTIPKARAALWLFEKAFGEPLGSTATKEQRETRYKVCRDRFIRLTNEACYEHVAHAFGIKLSEEGIPADLTQNLRVKDLREASENLDISEVYRAIFQAKVVNRLKIFMSVISIAALVVLFFTPAGVGILATAAIVLALGALLQIPTQTTSIQDWAGKKIWERYSDYLLPEELREFKSIPFDLTYKEMAFTQNGELSLDNYKAEKDAGLDQFERDYLDGKGTISVFFDGEKITNQGQFKEILEKEIVDQEKVLRILAFSTQNGLIGLNRELAPPITNDYAEAYSAESCFKIRHDTAQKKTFLEGLFAKRETDLIGNTEIIRYYKAVFTFDWETLQMNGRLIPTGLITNRKL